MPGTSAFWKWVEQRRLGMIDFFHRSSDMNWRAPGVDCRGAVIETNLGWAWHCCQMLVISTVNISTDCGSLSLSQTCRVLGGFADRGFCPIRGASRHLSSSILGNAITGLQHWHMTFSMSNKATYFNAFVYQRFYFSRYVSTLPFWVRYGQPETLTYDVPYVQ